jgi:hypothetical protein
MKFLGDLSRTIRGEKYTIWLLCARRPSRLMRSYRAAGVRCLYANGGLYVRVSDHLPAFALDAVPGA